MFGFFELVSWLLQRFWASHPPDTDGSCKICKPRGCTPKVRVSSRTFFFLGSDIFLAPIRVDEAQLLWELPQCPTVTPGSCGSPLGTLMQQIVLVCASPLTGKCLFCSYCCSLKSN